MQVPREEEVYRLSLSSTPPCSSPPPPASPPPLPPRPALHLGDLVDHGLPLTAPLLTLLAELVKPLTKLFSLLLLSSNNFVSGGALPLLLRGAYPPPRWTWRPARASTLSGAMQIFSAAVSTFLAFGWKVLWGSIIRIKCRQRLSGELGEGAWQSSCSSTTGSPRPRLHLRPRLQHLHLLHRGWLSGCRRNGSSYG